MKYKDLAFIYGLVWYLSTISVVLFFSFSEDLLWKITVTLLSFVTGLHFLYYQVKIKEVEQ